jgi:hypothetical protein
MVEHPTRRDVVLAGAALTMTGGRAVAEPSADATSPNALVAHGVVTETIDEPGASTLKGTPIEHVLVSNGRDVTRTDPSGRFSLPVEPGQAIFVIKPTGFQVPVDPVTRLPRFAYIHDPDGTPDALAFRYRGLTPTGPLPESIDFQLTRVAEPTAFDVLLLTDPQPESTAEIDYIRDDVVAGLIGSQAAFGITCGDLMFDDLSMYGRYNRIIGRIGLPWWNVGGNHDLDYEAPDARRSRDTFKRVFGPTYYAHEHGGALFVMLDNVDYLGAGSGKPGQHGAYRGFFPPDQLSFVKALLDATPRDRLIVFVMHIPLRTYLGADNPANQTVNAEALLALIGDRPAVSFAGHTHTTEHYYLGADAGHTGAVPHHHHVLTAVSGSWWSGPLDHRGIACADSHDGTPNGHHVLSIEGSTYTTRFVAATEPASTGMRISLETQFHQDDREVIRELSMAHALRSPITVEQAASTLVIVNVFDGGPKTKVAFVIDSGAPILMTRTSRPDPFIVQVYGRNPETIKKWVTPQPSSHVWQAQLPQSLASGTYALKVLAIDEYGREHSGGVVVEVT